MDNPFSIFIDFSELFPNFLMPNVQWFMAKTSSKRTSTRPSRAVFATKLVEVIPGVGVVEHW